MELENEKDFFCHYRVHGGRNVLSEFINSIFDVDKMLYFVAPDWWKPRQLRTLQFQSLDDLQAKLAGSVVNRGPPRSEQVRLKNILAKV